MLTQFIDHLTLVAEKRKIRTVYFHNFSRFDGILLMKHYASRGDGYTIKPLMRNHKVYELYYYDVNSLYPYIMKTCHMPGTPFMFFQSITPVQIIHWPHVFPEHNTVHINHWLHAWLM